MTFFLFLGSVRCSSVASSMSAILPISFIITLIAARRIELRTETFLWLLDQESSTGFTASIVCAHLGSAGPVASIDILRIIAERRQSGRPSLRLEAGERGKRVVCRFEAAGWEGTRRQVSTSCTSSRRSTYISKLPRLLSGSRLATERITGITARAHPFSLVFPCRVGLVNLGNS